MSTRPGTARGGRILVAHRYFWPDTPAYASILRRIAESWAAEGYDVTVFAGRPSGAASERPKRAPLGPLAVRRTALLPETGRATWRRAINFLLFPAKWAVFILTGPKPDLVMCATFPPVVMGFFTSLAARLRGARFVYHCMDIQPEIGRISGDFGSGVLYRLLRRMDEVTCRRAARVVVLSSDMAASLAARPRPPARAALDIRPNFVLPGYTPPTDASETLGGVPLDPGASFRILFAGNIGRFQGLDTLVAAVAALPTDRDVELVLVGDGPARPGLADQAHALGTQRVRFTGQQSISDAALLMRSAALCVVSLVPDIYRYAYPTKVMSYLSAQRPLLAILEAESGLAQLVRAEDIGITVPPGATEALSEALNELAQAPERLRAMRRRCADVHERYFSEANALAYWSDLAQRLIR